MSTKAVDEKNKTLFQNDAFQGHHKNGIIIKSHCKYFFNVCTESEYKSSLFFKKSRSHQSEVVCAIRCWATKETAVAVMKFSISRLGLALLTHPQQLLNKDVSGSVFSENCFLCEP